MCLACKRGASRAPALVVHLACHPKSTTVVPQALLSGLYTGICRGAHQRAAPAVLTPLRSIATTSTATSRTDGRRRVAFWQRPRWNKAENPKSFSALLVLER
jgi:hypothetical protein